MQIIYTELKDTLEYTCDVNVFNISMIMRVSYNSRSKKRLISLTSLDGSILYLKPTYITYGSRIFPNFNAIIDGLSFYITLDRLTLTGDNYLNWANQFRLCFVEYVPFEKGEGWYLAENSLEENSITPNFGEWVIIPDGISISGYNILYQAYKTNSISTYDSFATFSLETALIRSFLDTDMQQWQGFKDAVNELTGAVSWVLDPANNQIKYLDPNPTNVPYIYPFHGVNYTSPDAVCSAMFESANIASLWIDLGYDSTGTCAIKNKSTGRITSNGNPYKVVNPNYDPTKEEEEKTLPLDVVAAQVISNAADSANEVLKLLSEDYINLVVNSVFDSNPSDQFVKLSDLIDQFEANKTLRI